MCFFLQGHTGDLQLLCVCFFGFVGHTVWVTPLKIYSLFGDDISVSTAIILGDSEN